MKKTTVVCGVLTLIALALWKLLQPGAAWLGIDETVVYVVARQAGRAPHSPIINLGRGDLEIFFFLAAGAIGGFVAGYHFRALFVGKNAGKVLSDSRGEYRRAKPVGPHAPRSPKVGA